MTMRDKEIKELLSRGASSTITFDPSLKNEITTSALNSMVREIKSEISRKRKISVVLVKE
jgi:hypothetical protein